MAEADLNQESLAALRLSLVPHVGPQIHARLIAHFGSATEVLAAPLSALREVDGVGTSLAAAISRSDEQDVEAELIRCRQNEIEIIPLDAEKYPKNLREIYDPPPILYSRGTILPQDTLAIAIVGTRHATSYGKTQAARLASSLARSGLTIMSGLARGIDAAAHYGALEAGGRTVAVLPGGITNVYPQEHQELAFDITQQGTLLSESPSQHPISRGSFPRRNRIITGLSLGVIVVEAGERSGALVSARHAMEQGREVFAVPGPVDSRVSRGCHGLLRDGAKLVETAWDVLEELGPLVEATPLESGVVVHHPAELSLNDQEQRILQLIGSTATNLDSLVVASGLPVPRVLATISALEMRSLIRRVGGNRVARC